MPKASLIRPVLSADHWLVTDRRKHNDSKYRANMASQDKNSKGLLALSAFPSKDRPKKEAVC